MSISPEEFDASMRAKGWVMTALGWMPGKNLGAGGSLEPATRQVPQGVSANPQRRKPDDVTVAPLGVRTPKRLRQSSKPLLNKLETEYCTVLESIWSIVFKQAIRFRLGNGIWYKPDFFVMDAQIKPIAFEVKGPFAHRGGFENLKVAASLYPQIKWFLVWKDNGQWREQEILP